MCITVRYTMSMFKTLLRKVDISMNKVRSYLTNLNCNVKIYYFFRQRKLLGGRKCSKYFTAVLCDKTGLRQDINMWRGMK